MFLFRCRARLNCNRKKKWMESGRQHCFRLNHKNGSIRSDKHKISRLIGTINCRSNISPPVFCLFCFSFGDRIHISMHAFSNILYRFWANLNIVVVAHSFDTSNWIWPIRWFQFNYIINRWALRNTTLFLNVDSDKCI